MTWGRLMAHGHSNDSPASPATRPGRMVLAGMVIATSLGAGLGLWARPAPAPEPSTPPTPPLPTVLEVVVDDTPAPIGSLLEVLPAEMAAAAMIAPSTPPPRLMAAQVEGGAERLPVVALRSIEPLKVVAEAEPSPRKPAAQPKAKNKPTQARTTENRKLAAKARTEKASKPKALAKAKSKPSRNGELKVADAKPAKARSKKAVTKPAAKTPPARLAKAAAAPKPALTAREAPRDACALSDPGAALVCADQRLGARDRQLQRAYRRAEAAGVPPSALRRQQARWIEARAAAAREAPWAVEDVYVARISEINDMIRDAREN